MHADRAHQPVDVGEEELQIFECNEHSDRGDDGKPGHPSASSLTPLHPVRGDIRARRGHAEENQVVSNENYFKIRKEIFT